MKWGEAPIGMLVLIVTACAEPENPSQVQIPMVRSEAPEWDTASQWLVDSAPSLVIGVAEGTAGHELYRVKSAVRSADGGYIIGNAGSSEIRFFDAAGQFRLAAGGNGAGPGEFAEFSSLRICRIGNRLVVEDNGADRFHVFEEDGHFVETVTVSGLNGRPPNLLDCFWDGSLLTVSGDGSLQGSDGEVLQFMVDYHRYSTRGEHLDTIVRVTGESQYVNEFGGSVHYPLLPFSPRSQVAAGDSVLYVSDSGDAVVRKYLLTGKLIAEFQWNPGKRTRVKDVWDEYTRESLSHMGVRDLAMYRHFYARDLPLPELVPVVNTLKVDIEGNLWVEHMRPPGSSTRTWSVLTAEGQHLGYVETPAGVAVLEIGSDYVIGHHIDDLSVERVHVYRLSKPGVGS